MDSTLDGNAAAGALQEVFPFEMTMAEATCANCGAANVVGAVAAYLHGMGTVLRCPSCDKALIRLAHMKGHYWLDMRGVRALRLSDSPE